jgi:hypothetical protein
VTAQGKAAKAALVKRRMQRKAFRSQSETVQLLFRLKRWLGREKGRYMRIFHYAPVNSATRERAYGEANVCMMVMHKLDLEIKKLEEP